MQSCATELLDRLEELAALSLGDLDLQGAGLPGAGGAGESARAPRRAAVDLLQVGQLGEGLAVAERHVDDAVVR